MKKFLQIWTFSKYLQRFLALYLITLFFQAIYAETMVCYWINQLGETEKSIMKLGLTGNKYSMSIFKIFNVNQKVSNIQSSKQIFFNILDQSRGKRTPVGSVRLSFANKNFVFDNKS